MYAAMSGMPGYAQAHQQMQMAAAAAGLGSSATPGAGCLPHASSGLVTKDTTTSLGDDSRSLDTGLVSKDEQRRHALDRYRKKRNSLSFSKKIRYASRKQLAEQRPRIRGQFVKTTPSEADDSKQQNTTVEAGAAPSMDDDLDG